MGDFQNGYIYLDDFHDVTSIERVANIRSRLIKRSLSDLMDRVLGFQVSGTQHRLYDIHCRYGRIRNRVRYKTWRALWKTTCIGVGIDDFKTDYRDDGKKHDQLYRINTTTVRWGPRVIEENKYQNVFLCEEIMTCYRCSRRGSKCIKMLFFTFAIKRFL